MNFCQRLQNLRKRNGITQEILAEKLNVTRQTISKWERGESTPDFEHLIQISELFHITTDYLLKGELPHDEHAPLSDTAATDHMGAQKSHELSLLGASLFLGGLITNVVLFVLSVIYNMNWTGSIGTYDGLLGFLLWKNLVWLFVLMCFAIAIGLALLIFPFIKPYIQRNHTRNK